MNKTDLIVRCLSLVLSAGLVSCAKDEKTRDVFRAPPPVIHSKNTEELKVWDRRSDKSLDLQDSFDVRAGNPAKLEIVSRCRRGQQSYYEFFSLVPDEPVKIFRVLPAELLTSDMKSVPTECGFELTLLNDFGSKHIYQIGTVPVTDEGTPGVTLEKTGSLEKLRMIHARKLEGLRLRFRNSGAAAAEIACHEMALPALPFEQVAEMSSFDFSKPQVKDPVQGCRILIRQNGRLRQISARFLVQMPQPPMPVAVEPVVPTDQQKYDFENGRPLTAARIFVHNPGTAGARFLTVPKAAGSSTIGLFYADREITRPGQPNYLSEFSRPWAYAIPEGAEDKGDHYRLAIPAGRTAALLLQIRPPGRMNCLSGSVLLTPNLIVQAKLEFGEVSAEGEMLATVSAELSRTHYFSTVHPNVAAALPAPVTGPCQW